MSQFFAIRWPRYWSFSFSISPPNEYSGLISFRMDWYDILSVQGTLKSLLQHHSSKASILQHSAFFIIQLSHPYMTTGKLPRSKRLLISWLQSSSAVILETPKIKSATVSTVSPSICHEVLQYLEAISKMTDLCLFPRQTMQYQSNPSLCLDQ